jgi:hypothetical protein
LDNERANDKKQYSRNAFPQKIRIQNDSSIIMTLFKTNAERLMIIQ